MLSKVKTQWELKPTAKVANRYVAQLECGCPVSFDTGGIHLLPTELECGVDAREHPNRTRRCAECAGELLWFWDPNESTKNCLSCITTGCKFNYEGREDELEEFFERVQNAIEVHRSGARELSKSLALVGSDLTSALTTLESWGF